MRLVIQRCLEASVKIDGELVSSIGKGLLVLVGIEQGDTQADVMNLSVTDIGGEVLAVSQFTLTASTRKGNRPSYIRAAGHELAVPLYESYCEKLSEALGRSVGKGRFGADMKVSLVNDGPVTIIIDSRLRE